MSHSPPTFGKRGARAAAPVRAAPPPPEPSDAYRELAAAARQALSERRAPDDDDGRDSAPRNEGDDDMRAYVGRNWRAYRPLWLRMKAAPGLRWRRSFFAAAFSSLWLLYRKQYVLGVAILAAQAAMMRTEVAWSGIFDIVVAALCGQFGMSLVLLRGTRVIARIRASDASPQIATIRIGAAGGVNWIAALSGTALLAGVALAGISGAFSTVGENSEAMRSLLQALGPR